ncbi:FG-nucleoporin nsp1 [Coemansia sp. RSA 1200]|nr:FG-nucleoporin nsp1 [Coemansia sp. RSA 1200]
MFGNTGNSGSGGGFGFNLAGSKPNSTSGAAAGGFGAPASSGTSSSNMFSTPTTSNTNTTVFGAPGVASKPAASPFSFGTPTAASGGGGGSLFGGSAAASKPGEAAKPLTGFSFGTSAAQAPATGAAAAAAGGGGSSIFGGASKPLQTVSFGLNTSAPPAASTAALGFGSTSGASATAAPSGSLFGGTTSAAAAAPSLSGAGGLGFGGFGAKPAVTTGGTSLTSKAQTPFSLASPFGNSATTTAAAGTNASTTSTSTAAATGASNPTTGTGLGGFKLSTAPAVSEAGEKCSTTATAGTVSAAAGGSGSNTTTSTAKKDSATELANAALRGKTVEEIAQMWTSELATQTRAFHTQANTVAYWDRALVQQGKRITGLYEATMSVEAEQAALDQSLEHMEGQQRALQTLLDTYEGRIHDIVRKTTNTTSAMKRPGSNKGGVAMTADEERDHVYSSAERLNSQLDELARRLTTLVEDVNGISNATGSDSADGDAQQKNGAADPFAQIVEILNGHLTSLEWVDSQTAQLQDRVKTAQRVHQDVVAAQTALTGGAYGSEPVGVDDDRQTTAATGSSSWAPTIPGAFVSDSASRGFQRRGF